MPSDVSCPPEKPSESISEHLGDWSFFPRCSSLPNLTLQPELLELSNAGQKLSLEGGSPHGKDEGTEGFRPIRRPASRDKRLDASSRLERKCAPSFKPLASRLIFQIGGFEQLAIKFSKLGALVVYPPSPRSI